MDAIFDAGWQGWKVRFVVLICIAGAVMFAIGSGYFFTQYGLHPEDGGVLKPLGSRILAGSAMLAPGVALVAGMWVYGQCYISRVLTDGERIRIRLSGMFIPSWLEIGRDDVITAEWREGRSNAGGMAVNAPWYKVRVRGRRLPLILDMQGDFLDERRVDLLLLQEVPVPIRKVRSAVLYPVDAKKKRRK